jgi:hypothetical protein
MALFSLSQKLNITVEEFIKVLKQLGYKDVSEGDKFFHFQNIKLESSIQFPMLLSDEKMALHDLAANTNMLYYHGATKNMEEIVVKILENRNVISKKRDYKYDEFFGVLTKLGFKNEPTEKGIRYVNKKQKSIVMLPTRPSNDKILMAHVAAYAYQFYMQGIIKEEFDMILMLEEYRKGIVQKERV